MKKRISWAFLIFAAAFLLLATTPVQAAKKRVWGKTVVTTTTSSTGPFSVSARFSGWKQYLNISFRGVASTKGISYQLIYASKGIDQGAGGGVAPSEGNVTKTLFLGSCSFGVCTASKDVSNVRLIITYVTSGGQTVVKNYKVKY